MMSLLKKLLIASGIIGISGFGALTLFIFLEDRERKQNNREGLEAYQDGNCDIAIQNFKEVLSQETEDDLSIDAERYIEECELFIQTKNMADKAGEPSTALLAYASFISTYDKGPLQKISRSSAEDIFSKNEMGTIATVDVCNNQKRLLDLKLIPEEKKNMPVFYWECGKAYAVKGDHRKELDSYIQFLSGYSSHFLTEEVMMASLLNSYSCEETTTFQNNREISNLPNFLPSLYILCGRAYQSVANHAKAIDYYQGIQQYYPDDNYYNEIAQDDLHALHEDLYFLGTELKEAADSIKSRAAGCNTAAFLGLGLIINVIEAIGGEDCSTGLQLNAVERTMGVVPLAGELSGLQKIEHVSSAIQLVQGLNTIQSIAAYGSIRNTISQLEDIKDDSKAIHDFLSSDDNHELLLANSTTLGEYIEKIKSPIDLSKYQASAIILIKKEPVQLRNRDLPSIRKDAKPYIGIRTVSLTPELAKAHNDDPGSIDNIPDEIISMPEISGIVVVDIIPGSPSQLSDILVGDVIIEVNERVLKSSDDIKKIVEDSSIGDLLTLKVLRDGGTKSITVEISSLLDEQADEILASEEDVKTNLSQTSSSGDSLDTSALDTKPFIGIQMLTLTPELAIENNRSPDASRTLPEIDGVVILGVIPDSPADKVGLEAGDVVLEIDGEKVLFSEEVQAIVSGSNINQVLSIVVLREEETKTFSVKTVAATPESAKNE